MRNTKPFEEVSRYNRSEHVTRNSKSSPNVGVEWISYGSIKSRRAIPLEVLFPLPEYLPLSASSSRDIYS
jgi:hypothetical protein